MYVPCFDFFEGGSSAAEPARFRLPVGAAPFQAMVIYKLEVRSRLVSHNINTHEHPDRPFPSSCESLVICHIT